MLLDRPRRRARGVPEELHEALWDLAWAGEATNDAFAPLRARRLSARPEPVARAAAASRRAGPAAGGTVQGRWSLTSSLFREAPEPGTADARAGRADARALRHRHPRDGPGRGRPRRLLDALRRALEPGDARHRAPRATSSRAWAAPSSRWPARSSGCGACRGAEDELQILAVTDPANPYGASLSWPKRRGGPAPGPHRRRLRPAPRRRPAPLRRARRPRDPAPRQRSRARSWSTRSRSSSRPLATASSRSSSIERRRRRARDRLGVRGGADRGRLQPPAAAARGLGLDDARGRHDPSRRAAHGRRARRAEMVLADAPNPRSPIHGRAKKLEGSRARAGRGARQAPARALLRRATSSTRTSA